MPDNQLDPEGPILATLFAASSSDVIVEVIDRSGLHVDWSLTDRQAYSHGTRKREFRSRVGQALTRLLAEDRVSVLSAVARAVIDRNLTDSDSLNRVLAPTGWLFAEGELVRLLQGPTEPDAPVLSAGVEETAVIVTALGLEANAVKEHLTNVTEEEHEKGSVYFVGHFDGEERRWRVAIVIAGAGNTTAAIEVERAVERTRATYELAIAGYLYVVERWFSRFRDRMSHAVTFPARFRGVLEPPKSSNSHPGLHYTFELLPANSTSQVEIVLGPLGPLNDDFDEGLWNAVERERPESVAWISSLRGSRVLDVFGSCPATDIAYEWIHWDLTHIKWA